MQKIKIIAHSFPSTRSFVETVLSYLSAELLNANVKVSGDIVLNRSAKLTACVTALLYSDPSELKSIRNGSIRPNASFRIEPAPSTDYNRDYTVASLMSAITRICCTEVNAPDITILKMPEGLTPRALDSLVDYEIEFVLL